MPPEQRRTGAAVVVPLFAVDALLRSLGELKAPDEMRARVRERLRDLGGGGAGSGGGGQVAPGMPPAPPLAPAVAAASYGPAALVVSAVLGLVVGALWDPLHRSSESVEARPETVAAAVTAAPRTAPSATPSASVIPSPKGVPAPTRERSTADLDAERVLVKQVEDAIDAHDVMAALVAVEKHARRWPAAAQSPATRERLLRKIDAYMAAHPDDPQVIELRAQPKGTP